MTCILGYADGKNVWIGGDSAAQNGSWDRQTFLESKVFRCGDLLFGGSGSLRICQVIRELLILPVNDGDNDQNYLIAIVIPEMINLLEKYQLKLNDKEEGSTAFLIGYRGKIYKMTSDWAVYAATDQICKVGNGGDTARGAFTALLDQGITIDEIEKYMIEAMKIAGRFDLSVAPPYTVLKIGVES